MTETIDKKYEKILYNVLVKYFNKAKVTNENHIKDYLWRIERLSSPEFQLTEVKTILEELGFDSDEFEKINEEVGEAMRREPQFNDKKAVKTLVPTITLQDLFKEGIQPISWRVENIIPCGGIVIFGGSSGNYKTWLAMDLTMAIVTGTKFLGHFDTVKGTVLYIDEENGRQRIFNRFKQLKYGNALHNEIFDNLHLSISNLIKLNTEDATNLTAIIEYIKPDVVIIDSMVRCMQGDEDKSKDVRRIFDNLKPILTENPDISFLILHHTTKGKNRGMDTLRGSGDFAAFANVILMFTARKNYIHVEVVKNRDMDISEMPAFGIRPETVLEKNLKFKYLEFEDEQTTKNQDCGNDIEQWIEEHKVTSFKSGHESDSFKSMAKLGYSYNTYNDALKLLEKETVIGRPDKTKRGLWEVK